MNLTCIKILLGKTYICDACKSPTLKTKDAHRLEVKEWKNIFHASENEK